MWVCGRAFGLACAGPYVQSPELQNKTNLMQVWWHGSVLSTISGQEDHKFKLAWAT